MREPIPFTFECGEDKLDTLKVTITKLSVMKSVALKLKIAKIITPAFKGSDLNPSNIMKSDVDKIKSSLSLGAMIDCLVSNASEQNLFGIIFELFEGVVHNGTDLHGRDPVKGFGRITKGNIDIIIEDPMVLYALIAKALEVNYKSFLDEIKLKFNDVFPALPQNPQTEPKT